MAVLVLTLCNKRCHPMNIAGVTALCAAIMQQKHAAVQLLLQKGAQVQLENKDGTTSIELAQVKL